MKKDKYIQSFLKGDTKEFASYSFPYLYDFSIYLVEIIYQDEYDTVFGFTDNGTHRKYFTRKIFYDEEGFYIRFVQTSIYLHEFTFIKSNTLAST